MITDCQFLDESRREWARNICLEDTIYINSRSMNTFRINFAILYDFLDLSYNEFSCSCHVCVEVTLGFLKLKVTHFISSFRFDDGKVSKDGLFSKIFASIKDKGRLTSRNNFGNFFSFFIEH